MDPSLPILIFTLAIVAATGSVLSRKTAHEALLSSTEQISVKHASHASHTGAAPAKQAVTGCGLIELLISPEECGVHPRKVGR